MIRVLLRWLLRLGAVLVILLGLLLSPVIYTELACRGAPLADGYQPLLPPADRRDESRSFTTYPEWHIVHAYEDYAQVIATGDPHDFDYLRAVTGFWSSLCPMARMAGAHGGFTTSSKMTIYTIGVSFTAELALKAAYEETVGRASAWWRGPGHAALDDLAARQAAAYAEFLQQMPWYQWDFDRDASEVAVATVYGWRDRERRFAMGAEYSAKSVYAGVIAAAVAGTGEDALTIRSVVTGLPAAKLAAIPGVAVMAEPAGMPEGSVVIETPRYRAFTDILRTIAQKGGNLAEIAGNDDLLMTALVPTGAFPALPDGATLLFAFPRQGFADQRLLIGLRVADLGAVLRELGTGPVTLEHVHDY